MFRLYIFGAVAAAFMSAATALAYTCKAALDDAYARGQSEGRAEIHLQVQKAVADEQAAAAMLAQQASVKLTRLEEDRAHVQAQLDHAMEIARRSDLSAAVCLDARLLRALNRVGRDAANVGPAARSVAPGL